MYLLGLSITCRNDDVKGEDIVDLEFGIFDVLLECLLVEDDFVAIDEVLLEIVGEYSFEWLHSVSVSDFLGCISDLRLCDLGST